MDEVSLSALLSGEIADKLGRLKAQAAIVEDERAQLGAELVRRIGVGASVEGHLFRATTMHKSRVSYSKVLKERIDAVLARFLATLSPQYRAAHIGATEWDEVRVYPRQGVIAGDNANAA